MARDLILRRVTGSCARDDLHSPSLGILPTATSVAAVLLPHLVTKTENRRYRRLYDDGLSTTREMPAVSMSDLVYGGDQ